MKWKAGLGALAAYYRSRQKRRKQGARKRVPMEVSCTVTVNVPQKIEPLSQQAKIWDLPNQHAVTTMELDNGECIDIEVGQM